MTRFKIVENNDRVQFEKEVYDVLNQGYTLYDVIINTVYHHTHNGMGHYYYAILMKERQN